MAHLTRHAGSGALLAAAFLIALLPRALDLDRVVTPDEPLWLARSANFAEALADGDLSRTYQFVHPGVTVTWAGALGIRLSAPSYTANAPGQIRQRGNEIEIVLREQGLDPLEVLERARQVLAVAIAATLAVMALYAARLLGLGAAAAGFALIALDPFHVALSRLLHLDGLFSCLLTLTLLAWLVHLRNGRRLDLIVAGVTLGLAGLTRTVAVVGLPVILASTTWYHPESVSGMAAGRSLRGRLTSLALLAAIALATVVIAWPALWVSSAATLRAVVDGTVELGGRAHEGPIYFNGTIHGDSDPGLLFYPISLLWRATPALLAGLLLAAVALALRRGRWNGREQERAIVFLLLLALTDLALLNLSAKKFDRYAVSLLPALAFIAGWGWVVATRRLLRSASGFRRAGAGLLAAAGAFLVIVNGMSVVRAHPYGLDYYNPMLGGGATAPRVMMVGWGEGLDQVARFLDEQPDAPDLRIGSSAWSFSLTYFLGRAEVHTVRLDDPATAMPILLTQDLFVRYITADQRGYLTDDTRLFLDSLTPILRVRLNGIDYAAVYDLRSAALPASFIATRSTLVAPGLRFIFAELPGEPVQPGASVSIRLYLTGAPGDGVAVPIHYALRDPGGRDVTAFSDVIAASPTLRPVWYTRHELVVPPDLPPGKYELVAWFGESEPAPDDVVTFGSMAVQAGGASGAELSPADEGD